MFGTSNLFHLNQFTANHNYSQTEFYFENYDDK